MGIVRFFSLTKDFGLDSNEDVDQFHMFQKQMNVLPDDFVFKQKCQGTSEESIQFLQQKYQARAENDPEYKKPETIHIDGMKEGKNFVSAKQSTLSNIDWSVDSRYIVVNFKVAGQIVVWDIISCQRIYQLDYTGNGDYGASYTGQTCAGGTN